MTRTPEQWLALPKVKLDVALGKLLNKKPWEHDWFDNLRVPKCSKCGCDADSKTRPTFCSVPDRIDSEDWGEAMKWRDKIAGDWGKARLQVYNARYRRDLLDTSENKDIAGAWFSSYLAKSKDWFVAIALMKLAKDLIAATTVAERGEG